jgi:hypothetical protein
MMMTNGNNQIPRAVAEEKNRSREPFGEKDSRRRTQKLERLKPMKSDHDGEEAYSGSEVDVVATPQSRSLVVRCCGVMRRAIHTKQHALSIRPKTKAQAQLKLQR